MLKQQTLNELEQIQTEYINKYVQPHNIISKECIESDIPVIVNDSSILYSLCFIKRGLYNGGYAVAHQQINNINPLRFFVVKNFKTDDNNGLIVINPVIIKHTDSFINSLEGCLSFPNKKMINVQRYNKCVVQFKTLINNNDENSFYAYKFSDVFTMNLNGIQSKIFQHEIDHFDCKYIYNNI